MSIEAKSTFQKKKSRTKFLPSTKVFGGPKLSLVGGGVRLRCKSGSTKGFVEAESKFQKKKSKLWLIEVPVEFKSKINKG